MKIEDDYVYYLYGVVMLDLKLLLFVSMAVVDHYDHHGGMHTLPLTTRTGQATS